MVNTSTHSKRKMSRGLRSTLILSLFCVLGAIFATWVTFEIQHTSASAPDFTSASNLKAGDDIATVETVDYAEALEALGGKSGLDKRTGTLKRKSTPLNVLRELGADGREAYLALQAIYDAEYVNPRRLIAGLKIHAFFDETTSSLRAVSFQTTKEVRIISKRMSDGTYFAAKLSTQLQKRYHRVSNKIQDSFYLSAQNHGLRDKQISDYAQIFAFDVDFQREIRNGDEFEIVYEVYTDEAGNHIRNGDVIFAAFRGNAVQKDYYRHTPSDDNITDYFTAEGKAATRFLMKTPINGARLSSGFGRRRHPISGYTRLHKGIDFAARTGTPIFAAGNGVVERASRYGGYGRYVRIQHANQYETAYAHMSRYGPGIKSGKRVRQGDIIGYVGSSGASTGPHLHYEVIIRGKHVNARALKLPTGRTLEGNFLQTFSDQRAEIDALRQSLGAGLEIAATAGGQTG